MKSILALLMLALTAPVLTGCAALQVATSKKNLDVQNKMSTTVFLEPTTDQREKTVFVQVRNTSDKKDFDIQPRLIAALNAKGYRVVEQTVNAKYLLFANVLQVGMSAPNAAEAAVYQGYGMDGAILGASAAYLVDGSDKAILGAGIVGGMVSVLADSAVKDVYFSAIVDIQVKEKASMKIGAQQRIHQTRILSFANKVNLNFTEALPALKEGIAHSVAGIF